MRLPVLHSARSVCLPAIGYESTLAALGRAGAELRVLAEAAAAPVQSSIKMETCCLSQAEQVGKLARGMLGAKLQARFLRHTVATEAVRLAKMAGLLRATAAPLAVAEH